MAVLSDNFHATRNHIVIIFGLFVLQRFANIDIEGQIPFINIEIPLKADSLLILTMLSISFFIRLTIDWFQSEQDDRKKTAAKLDFSFALLLASIPIVVSSYDYLKETFISDMPLFGSLLLLGIGEFIARTTTVQISSLKYIRSKEKARQKGLHRIPVAVRATFFYTPINLFMIFIIYLLAKYLFTEPLSEYWVYLIGLPFLIHIPMTIFDYWGFSKEYHEAMQKIFDQHDTRYQIGGWDKKAQHVVSQLYAAAESGDINTVKQLLHCGANPNEVNPHGWSPFLISVAQGHESIVDLFLEYGADVNQSNTLGRTALMFASNYGFIEMMKKLIENGANVNAFDSGQLRTPLMAVSENGDTVAVELLLNNNADISIKDRNNKTALDYAEQSKHGEIAKILRRKMNSKN